MNKKTGKFGIILLLSLALMPFSSIQTDANSLTQLDIRKASPASSSVDVTLYTTTPYGDSIAVTKKSDNKYVILMPNVSSSAGSKPDLSGIKDIISDIDVKSVNDGAGGYTKVTLITTKPINIRTHAQNSVPLTAEQKAYKTLIAQSRTHTNTPVYIPDSRKLEPKTTVTVNKPAQPVQMSPTKQETASQKKENILEVAQHKIKESAVEKNEKKAEEKPKTSNADTRKAKPAAVKEDISQHIPEPVVTPVQKADVKPPVKDFGILSSLKSVKAHIGRILPNMPITLAMVLLPLLGLFLLFKLIKKSVASSNLLKKSFMEHLATKPVLAADYEEIISNPDLNWQEKYQRFLAENGRNNELSPMQTAAKKYTFIKSQNTALKHDFEENMVKIQPKAASNPPPAEKINRNKIHQNIVMDDAVEELERQIDKLEAEKEIKPVVEEQISMKEEKRVNNMMENEKYLVSLEKLLHDSPDVEKTNLDEDAILKSLEQNFKDITVHSEDNMIASRMSDMSKMAQMSKSKKLKAFANKVALEESYRNRPLPKTREEVKSSAKREGRHVGLGHSKLHSNPRMLENGNLSVADLIAKSSKFMQKPVDAPKAQAPTSVVPQSKPIFEREKGYSMSSLEEFFSLPEENNRVTASPSLSNKVAESLAQVKPSMKMQKVVPAKDNVTNPIAQLKSDTKDKYLNGLIIKSGFNIDKNKGLYIVNLDGESALVGRINEEIFILKKFAHNVERPLQVRQDNPNVYMVKADGFRSLVEVSEDKMGVLIEL